MPQVIPHARHDRMLRPSDTSSIFHSTYGFSIERQTWEAIH